MAHDLHEPTHGSINHTVPVSRLGLGRARPASTLALAGPGWFESSWDLQRGLNVCEGWPREVSLAMWSTPSSVPILPRR